MLRLLLALPGLLPLGFTIFSPFTMKLSWAGQPAFFGALALSGLALGLWLALLNKLERITPSSSPTRIAVRDGGLGDRSKPVRKRPAQAPQHIDGGAL